MIQTKYPRRKAKPDRKKEFQKIKKKLLSKFPGATTKMDSKGRFYLVDQYGKKILTNEFSPPNQKTVRKAWTAALRGVWLEKIVVRNNSKFSDEKIIKKIEKEI